MHDFESMWGVRSEGKEIILGNYSNSARSIVELAALFNETLRGREDRAEFFARMIPLDMYGAQLPDSQRNWMESHGMEPGGENENAYFSMLTSDVTPHDCFEMIADLGQVYVANVRDLEKSSHDYTRCKLWKDITVCIVDIDTVCMELTAGGAKHVSRR